MTLTQTSPHIHIGTLTLTAPTLMMGDPCYFIGCPQGTDMTVGFAVPEGVTRAECYVAHEDGVVASMTVLWRGTPDTAEFGECVADLGVDSGQMAVFTAEALAAYAEDGGDFRDIRVYRHRGTGRTLQYLVDFPNFAAPIASEGGQSMNELNATGEWEKLPHPEPLELNYDGVCHCHDNPQDAAVLQGGVFVCGSGYGDGFYYAWERVNGAGEVVGYTVEFITPDEEQA